ncbi:MAG: ferrous iron transport protein A [Nitrospirae bacterium]|nr:ferrous iron transport protein A [Nitrospirota bacterium]
MEERIMPLTMAPRGKEVTLIGINGGRGVRMRLHSLGLIPGVKLRVLNNNGAGPLMVAVMNSRVALGWGMAYKIMVEE